ncbi:MAG: PAS domain-containing protein [Chlamydiota bacterium]
MQQSDLQVFNTVPFFFWAKDENGVYIWVNEALKSFAKEDIIGKTDDELPWSNNAEAFQSVDLDVLNSGKPKFLHEHLGQFMNGSATLSVCKYPGEFEGKKCTFGISFIIDQN